ncbi:MAG: SEC-C domain-containing protein [Chromatiaceae bacterium]|nr:MAG: SEC-C domain-containing protein [Chromatiaceae bacterium]
MTDSDPPHPQRTPDSQRMEQLIRAAIEQVRADGSLDGFLAWARSAIPAHLEMDDELDSIDAGRLSTLLGLSLWNAIPRADHGWQPLMQPVPHPHERCLCGSGLRYRDCCEPFGPMPELPIALVWELLLADLPEAAIQEALRQDAIPRHLYALIAANWLEQGRAGRAVALLEPLFAAAPPAIRPVRTRSATPAEREPPAALDSRFEPALDVLCDAYDQLDHWKKKQTFLLRMTETGDRALKAAAWQRFCTMFIDEGQYDYATEAFAQAQRQAPDSAATAVLELTLLAAQHRDEHARARAHFWQHKLRRAGQAERPIMDFLAHAAVDPQDALVASHAADLDPLLLALRDWIAGLTARPLVPHRIELIHDLHAAIGDRQLPLFPAAELPRLPDPPCHGEVGALYPAPELRQLERAWHRRFRAVKPPSTHLLASQPAPVWDDDTWLGWLQQEPAAGDSLDILDDLATALYERPESSLPWIAHQLLAPLLERANAIIDLSLSYSGARQLPWSDERNRAALRLLFRLYLYHAEAGDSSAAAMVLERLLALNPRDNHGVRAELMNHYLRQHHDEQALALARRFPTDILADLAYGEVLALYRLGRQERAAEALDAAVGRLPLVPRFLLRKRIKRPPLTPGGFTPGGDDQAWLYREAMRDVWESEPGLLDWMRRHTA